MVTKVSKSKRKASIAKAFSLANIAYRVAGFKNVDLEEFSDDDSLDPTDENIEKELAKKGLRPASYDEAGWFDRPLGIKMWVTDLVEKPKEPEEEYEPEEDDWY